MASWSVAPLWFFRRDIHNMNRGSDSPYIISTIYEVLKVSDSLSKAKDSGSGRTLPILLVLNDDRRKYPPRFKGPVLGKRLQHMANESSARDVSAYRVFLLFCQAYTYMPGDMMKTPECSRPIVNFARLTTIICLNCWAQLFHP